MLSEFECQSCGVKFVTGFTDAKFGQPVQHCVHCGSKDLKYLGSSEAIIREVAVQEISREQASEIASMMERVFRNVPGGNSAECQLLGAIAEEFHKLTEK